MYLKFLVFYFFLYKLAKYIFFRRHFRHKCVLITGGAGALGVSLAKEFLKTPDTKVILMDINEENLNNVKKQYPKVITVKCNITDYSLLKETVENLLTEHNIDTIINNAGIVSKKSLLELTTDEINLSYNVNSIAPMYLTKLILPHMIKNKRGHIINISSIAGLVGINRLTDYCASKFALVGFHCALRAELAQYKNIHTSCICPYFFRSTLFDKCKGYPWPLNYIMYVYSVKEIATLIHKDVKNLRELVIYPKIFGWLLRIRYMFPIYVQDKFITWGSNID